jgi:ATP-dependent DNA ligase
MPPIAPMLSKAAARLPEGDGWLYEPKWDGFRCIAFRSGDEVELWSRSEKPLLRYFPEVPEQLRVALPERCVVDGELAVAGPAGLDFDLLGQRIHPADSRVQMLARTTPSTFIAFDLLALDDRDLRDEPLAERRRLLEEVLKPVPPAVMLTPATTDHATAERWFSAFEGAGLDGIVAKSLAGRYTSGERTMVKVKHERTADCVVAGFRIHKDGEGIGSLLLGLYDDGGTLHQVGSCASFSVKQRSELVDQIEPVRMQPDEIGTHPWAGWGEAVAHETVRMPGAPHRWSARKDHSWEPVRPELVCEVKFDQLTARRFRHNAKFVRWRPDREASSCRYDQLDVALPVELMDVFQA